MRWTTRLIVGCLLLIGSGGGGWRPADQPAAAAPRATADEPCLACHPSAAGVTHGPMATRARERAFVDRAFGAPARGQFDRSCGGCHVVGCRDCHGGGPRPVARPPDEACLRCHRGYFVGWDYHGRAPREDHGRYQRGPSADGERFLTMAPDVHHLAGLTCADCHSMASLQQGRRPATRCQDCHRSISRAVPDHAITAHLDRMECQACHAAWVAQEYGTFLVRPRTDAQRDAFAPLPALGEWRRSALLRRQDAPPLGLNARGRVAPIRPEFILFATDPARGWENRLLAAEWRPVAPHTIRRGTSGCAGCHDSPRRFLLEADEDRLYRLDEDGLALRSFWNRAGQLVRGGAFMPPGRYAAMNRKSPAYIRGYLEQWQRLIEAGDPSSGR